METYSASAKTPGKAAAKRALKTLVKSRWRHIALSLAALACVGSVIIALPNADPGGCVPDARADGSIAADAKPARGAGATANSVEELIKLEHGGSAPDARTTVVRGIDGISGRNFIDQTGDPLYLKGDAGWSLIGALTIQETRTYLDLLVKRGFNMVLFNAIEGAFSDSPPAAAQPGAGTPFEGAMFRSNPREDYWAHVDDVVDEMEARGLIAMMNPAYCGSSNDQGIGSEMEAASDQALEDFGRFIGNRYGARKSIIFQIGGDRNFSQSDTIGRRYAALAQGIHMAAPSAIATVMTGPGRYSSQMWDPNWLDFESVYENNTADLRQLDVWQRTSLPLVYAEPAYEGARWPDEGWSALYGRRQLWISFGMGYSGVIPGNCLRWHFGEDPLDVGCPTWGRATWVQTLEDTSRTAGPGGRPADTHARDTEHFFSFVEGVSWAESIPDTHSEFLFRGVGRGTDRAAARIGPAIGIVYIPSSRRKIVVDTTRVGPIVRMRWYDPTSGQWSTITDAQPATSNQPITHPGNNAAGDWDWVLVVDRP